MERLVTAATADLMAWATPRLRGILGEGTTELVLAPIEAGVIIGLRRGPAALVFDTMIAPLEGNLHLLLRDLAAMKSNALAAMERMLVGERRFEMLALDPWGSTFSTSRMLTRAAVAHYWRTLDEQGNKQKAGHADRGGRAAVTGGKQMTGFCNVVQKLLEANGMSDVHVYVKKSLELPGYFRPTKTWDMLVVNQGHLIAAIEFKSQRGPSFGNNFNNRTEEAIGTATDLWTAYREGAFGKKARPWLGWVMLVEDCPKSTTPVRVSEPHFKVFPEFHGASYAKRYELLLCRLVREKLFDGAAFLMATEKQGPKGIYSEPSPTDLGMKQFLAGLVAHALAYQASIT